MNFRPGESKHLHPGDESAVARVAFNPGYRPVYAPEKLPHRSHSRLAGADGTKYRQMSYIQIQILQRHGEPPENFPDSLPGERPHGEKGLRAMRFLGHGTIKTRITRQPRVGG